MSHTNKEEVYEKEGINESIGLVKCDCPFEDVPEDEEAELQLMIQKGMEAETRERLELERKYVLEDSA